MTIGKEEFDELIKKMKQYMVLTSEVMNGAHDGAKYRGKIKVIFKELTKLIDKVEEVHTIMFIDNRRKYMPRDIKCSC